MEPNQAAEQLQAIRTLMERSAVYRRALAPIMIYCGAVGLIGGVAGDLLPLHESRRFVFYWAAVAVLALIGSFLLVRRQAFRDSEPFWSPPTRRVAQALIPGIVVGAFAGSILAWLNPYWYECRFIVPLWCVLFGLALHSAGFFMPRGLKLFGWLFLAMGILLFSIFMAGESVAAALVLQPHWLMGLTFGGLHLAYGIYLYFTEKRGKTS
jgi:hypothetical protein